MANRMQLAYDIRASQKQMELEDAEEIVKEIYLHGELDVVVRDDSPCTRNTV